MKDTRQKWGIPLSDLQGEKLYYVPAKYDQRPDKTFSLIKKFYPYRELIDENYGWSKSLKRLEETSRYFPVSPYFDRFSFDQLAKYMFGQFISNSVSDAFQRKDYHDYQDREHFEVVPPEPAELVYKIRNSMHHYGDYPSSWNALVTAYYAIPDFDFTSRLANHQDFEVRFDHTRYFNDWGQAQHTSDQLSNIYKHLDSYDEQNQYLNDNTIFLDGIFAYLIYYRGQHVMTVSFSVGLNKILLCQVQLRSKRGNRWVYKLPTDYFNYVIEVFYQHFVEKWRMELFLVDGPSLAQKIAKTHSEDNPMDPEAFLRIGAFYNQELELFRRGAALDRQNLRFYKLVPNI